MVSSRFAAGDFEALLYGLKMPLRLDPRPFLHSDAAENGFNYGGFSNPAMDNALARFQSATSFDTRCELLGEIQITASPSGLNPYRYSKRP